MDFKEPDLNQVLAVALAADAQADPQGFREWIERLLDRMARTTGLAGFRYRVVGGMPLTFGPDGLAHVTGGVGIAPQEHGTWGYRGDAVVDTGASTLVLGADAVSQIGSSLPNLGPVDVTGEQGGAVQAFWTEVWLQVPRLASWVPGAGGSTVLASPAVHGPIRAIADPSGNMTLLGIGMWFGLGLYPLITPAHEASGVAWLFSADS